MVNQSRRNLANRLVVVADQGLLSGFAFLTTLVLLRGMGLVGFGEYSLLAMGWLWGLGLVQALLIQPMQTLLGSRVGTRRKAYLGGCWQLACIGMPLVAAMAGGTLIALGYSAITAGAFGFFLVARTLQMQLRGAAFAVGDRRGALLSDAIGQVGGFLAVVLIGPRIEWSLSGILMVQALAWGLATGYSWIGFEGRGVRAFPLWAMASRHWQFSRWLTGMAAVRWLSSNAFLLAVAAQFGPAALAVMRGAQAIVGVANLGLAAMESVLPTGAALHAGRAGEAGLFAYLRGFAVKGALPVALLIGGLIVFAEPALVLVFGGAVPDGARGVLMGFACLPASSFLYTLYSVAYRTLRRTHHMFWAYGVVAAVVVAMAPWVVGNYGLAGAAWGMTLQPLGMSLLLALGLGAGSKGLQPSGSGLG